MWTLAETLDSLSSSLPASLTTSDGYARVMAVARGLPAQLTNCIYFECPLPDHARRVDLIVRIHARDRAMLVDVSESFCEAPDSDGRAWQHVHAFAREWADSHSALSRGIEGAWLEFDLRPDEIAHVLRPRVFVDFTADVQTCASIEARRDLAIYVLDLLGHHPSSSAERVLRDCFERLPSVARLLYLGLAPGVIGSPLRVCVTDLGGNIAAYLAAVRWPGDDGDLQARVLAPMEQHFRAASILHLDVSSAGPRPRIGLEYAFTRASQREGRLRERACLDELASRGACAAATHDMLLSWPGQSIAWLAHEIWRCRVSRRLSHLKVTYATGEPEEIKAYLCAWSVLQRGGIAPVFD